MRNLILALGACVTIGACTIAPYDNNEYEALVRTKVLLDSAKLQCPDIRSQVLGRLKEQAKVFEVYTQYRLRNEQTYDIAVVIADEIDQLATRAEQGDMSMLYCVNKTDLISFMIEDTLSTLDRKNR